MNPCDPALAPVRCWVHEDCLEHPELALACATELTYVLFEDAAWTKNSGDGSDTENMCRYGFVWRASNTLNAWRGDGGCRAVHDGDGEGGGWIDDGRRIPYNLSSAWGTDEVWPGSPFDLAYRASVDNLQRRLGGAENRRGDFLETE